MKSILISLFVKILVQLVGRPVVDELITLVKMAETKTQLMGGSQKRQFVVEYIKNQSAVAIKQKVQSLEGRLFNLALETVVVYAKRQLARK